MSETEDLDTLKENQVYNEGDFEIISSDGIVFRIQSYHLLSASTVIRNMFSTSSHGDRRLELDDKGIETASTIQYLLDIITGRTWGDDDYPPDPSDLSNMLKVARKFDCVQAVRTCNLLLSDQLSLDPSCADEVFCAAASNGLDDLCKRAIQQFGLVGHHEYDEHKNGEHIITGYAEGYKSDPLSWSITQWMSIPPEYTWALLRCQQDRAYDEPWKRRGKLFARLLEDCRTSH